MAKRGQQPDPVWKRRVEARRVRRQEARGETPVPSDRAYIERLEGAVLAAERILADPPVARRKGYSPRWVFAVADTIRARRRMSPGDPVDVSGYGGEPQATGTFVRDYLVEGVAFVMVARPDGSQFGVEAYRARRQ